MTESLLGCFGEPALREYRSIALLLSWQILQDQDCLKEAILNYLLYFNEQNFLFQFHILSFLKIPKNFLYFKN